MSSASRTNETQVFLKVLGYEIGTMHREAELWGAAPGLRSLAALQALAFAAVLGGCPTAHVPPDACAACADAGPSDLPVDVLLVVNQAGGTFQQRDYLYDTLPALVRRLRDRGVDSLRVATIGADMGSGALGYFACDYEPFGRDGIFRTSTASGEPTCDSASTEPVLSSDGLTDGELAHEVACRASLRPAYQCESAILEAAMKALTPPSAGPVFSMGTTGHLGSENHDFAAPGHLLAVVVVTTRDDCSWSRRVTEDGASPDCPVSGDGLAACCDPFLEPVGRYVDGLSTAAALAGAELAVVVIAPVPEALVPPIAATLDYDALLTQATTATRNYTCDAFAGVYANAAPRLIELADRLGDRATLRSSCPIALLEDREVMSRTLESAADWIADRARAE